MTHDLMKNIMCDLEAILAKVIITDIVENTYYAELHIERDGKEKIIDCRPSDAVALALKNRAKIYVSRQVLETSVLADMFSNFLGGEDRIDHLVRIAFGGRFRRDRAVAFADAVIRNS